MSTTFSRFLNPCLQYKYSLATPDKETMGFLQRNGQSPTSLDSSFSNSWGAACNSLNTWLENNKTELPMMPSVATQVLELTRDENSHQKQLAELIQTDQTLASWTMKVANSAAFKTAAPLVSLQQAIARLGMDLIANIAVSATLKMKVFKAEGKYEDLMHNLALDAFSQALWAKEIATHLRSNTESAFLCGLLQSVGKPIVLQAISTIEQEQHIDLNQIQVEDLLNKYHKEFGVYIAEKWELPTVIRYTIEYSDNFKRATQHTNMVTIVNCAKQFVLYQNESEHYHLDELLHHPTIPGLNIYREEVDKILEASDTIAETVATLNI